MKRKPSPAIVIACIALFLALAGSGGAASGYRITSLWQISPKVRQALLGARGPVGPQGIHGPQGSQGAQGIQGPPGVDGTVPWARVTTTRQTLPLSTPNAQVNVSVSCGTYHVLTGGFAGQNDVVTTSQELSVDGANYWNVIAHL